MQKRVDKIQAPLCGIPFLHSGYKDAEVVPNGLGLQVCRDLPAPVLWIASFRLHDPATQADLVHQALSYALSNKKLQDLAWFCCWMSCFPKSSSRKAGLYTEHS